MFDWDDEELRNIIWGEDWERSNCNDPFSDQIEDICEKGTNEQTSGTSTDEGKKSNIKSEHRVDLDSISVYDVGERPSAFCPDTWPAPADLSLRNVAKAEQDSLCTDECNYLKEDEAPEWDKHSEIVEKPADDEEERDSVFYEWANIGSFEDLDRMFSDSDTIFGNLADSNADALWSSTKDSTNIPLNFTPLTGDSNEQSETADRAMLVYPSQSSSGYQKTNDVKYRAPQNVQALVAEGSIHGSHKLMNEGASVKHNGTPDQVNQQGRFKGHYVPSLELNQQSLSVHSQGFQLKHLSSVQLDPSNKGSIMNYYTVPPVPLSSGYEAPPVNANSSRKSEDAPAKPLSMTPTEKIEKLRKRQQMRAVRAIQKQQLQSKNQASVSGNFSMEGGKVAAFQSVSNLPFHETSSVTEQDDPRTANMVMDNCSMVESILYRLQETVVKLDMRIRLIIRDSLFRLARSAMQRKYPNDTNISCASSRNEACNNKDMIKNKQLSKVIDMETETNPIDRTVARLLFHVGLSGKPAETSESPSSKSIANEHLLDVSESSQMTTTSHGMKSSSTSFYHGMMEMETETCN